MANFNTPGIPPHHVPRTELYGKLEEPTGQHVYIHAPAGYGKTVAIASWARPLHNKCAWISLEAADDTPFRFYCLLLSAICHAQRANRRIRSQLDKLPQSAYPLEVLLDALQMLLKNDKRYLLVVDDWHCIKDSAIQASFGKILQNMPDNWRVVVLSRRRPCSSLARLVLRQRLLVLGARDLKFTLPEIQQLYKKNGQPLSEQEGGQILAETEGWAIAVNARRLGQARFAGGGNDLFSEYLDEQILGNLHARDQEMLIKTSVAGQLSGPLCRHITGIDDCGTRLEALYAANIFLYANASGTYSTHQLFREYLLSHFKKLPLETQAEVLERAGEWYIDNKDYITAVDYFVQTKNVRKISLCFHATHLYKVSNDIEWRKNFFRRKVMDHLDERYIQSDLVLMRQKTWFHFLDGDAAGYELGLDEINRQLPGVRNAQVREACLFLASLDYRVPALTLMQELKQALAAGPARTPGNPIYSTTITLNLPYAHRSMRDYSECANILESFLALARQSIGVMIGEEYQIVEDCVYAGIYYEKNELDKAKQAALRAITRCKTGYSPEVCFCAHMILMDVLNALGEARQAQRQEIALEEMIESRNALYLEPNYRAFLYSKHIGEGNVHMAEDWLLQFGTDRKGPLPLDQIYRHFTTARAYIAVGQWEQAVLFLEKLIRLAECYRRPLDRIQGNILLAIAYWQLHERKMAQAAMEQAVCGAQGHGFIQPFLNENKAVVRRMLQTLLRSVRSSPSTQANIRFLRSILFRLPAGGIEVELPAAPTHLSRRQQEVLALMAQNLPYEEIAERLGIRYSTVKTHVQKLFQKLNANSFEGAVAAAQEQGLISAREKTG